MPKNIFGKVTAYQTQPFCMTFVCSIVVFFIDYYCAGVCNKHCLLSVFSFILVYLCVVCCLNYFHFSCYYLSMFKTAQ